jgi:hypothetical protein
MIKYKTCITCKITKSTADFQPRNPSKDGYRNDCRECLYIKKKKYREENAIAIKEHKKEFYQENKKEIAVEAKAWREEHKEQISEQGKIYYQKNKDKISKYCDDYYLKNRDKILEQKKDYYQQNKKEIIQRVVKYGAERIKTDMAYKLRKTVSKAVSDTLKYYGLHKNGESITKYLPYPIKELYEHLEKQFEDWMTWENHGNYDPKIWDDNDPTNWTWQIDHIIPQSDLPYKTMEDENFKQCWALENLRPLNAKQNQLDGATRIRHKKEGNENAEGTNNE